MLLGTAALSHRSCEQQFPLEWVSQLEVPRPGSLWGCRCVRGVAAKKAVGGTGAKKAHPVWCGGEIATHTALTSLESPEQEGDISWKCAWTGRRRNFFGNVSIQ